MAFTGSFVCKSFISELFAGTHAIPGDTLKLALYTSSASLNADTTAYSATNEASGSGYSAGGETVTNPAIAFDGKTLCFDCDDVTFSAVTLTARGALLYNSSKANRAIAVIDFGSDKTKSAADLVVQMPVADEDYALMRFKVNP